jgi:hypothetical protein
LYQLAAGISHKPNSLLAASAPGHPAAEVNSSTRSLLIEAGVATAGSGSRSSAEKSRRPPVFGSPCNSVRAAWCCGATDSKAVRQTKQQQEQQQQQQPQLQPGSNSST